jgi:hypothetical protein
VYAAYHQSGTVNKDGSQRMVQRMVVPSTARGIPKAWQREFAAIASKVAQEYFNGRAATARMAANSNGGGGGPSGKPRSRRPKVAKARGGGITAKALTRLAKRALRAALK